MIKQSEPNPATHAPIIMLRIISAPAQISPVSKNLLVSASTGEGWICNETKWELGKVGTDQGLPQLSDHILHSVIVNNA